jgi:hypothetical protein
MPVALATGMPNPYGITVVGDTVLWAAEGNGGSPGAIWSAPTRSLDGGTPALIVTQNGPYLIAADAQYVYWTNQWTNSVFRGARAGGTAIEIAPGQDQASGITVTATHIYWTTYKGGQVMRTAVPGGGALETLATGQLGPAGLAADAQHVYFANFDEGTIARVPIAGGGVDTLAKAQNKPLAVAIDDKNVYWSSAADGSISSCPLAGGAVAILAQPSSNAVGLGVVVDGPRLFYTRANDSQANPGVYTAPVNPGNATPLAQVQGLYPSAIAQDAKALYFTNFYVNGAVMRLAK